jgi:hypothetical protein
MFLSASPGNGVPPEVLPVGADMSTIQDLRSVRLPAEVARAAEGGRMMCRPVCFDIEMLRACEKLGLRIPGSSDLDISLL